MFKLFKKRYYLVRSRCETETGDIIISFDCICFKGKLKLQNVKDELNILHPNFKILSLLDVYEFKFSTNITTVYNY